MGEVVDLMPDNSSNAPEVEHSYADHQAELTKMSGGEVVAAAVFVSAIVLVATTVSVIVWWIAHQ
jgi:hypothetical protein